MNPLNADECQQFVSLWERAVGNAQLFLCRDDGTPLRDIPMLPTAPKHSVLEVAAAEEAEDIAASVWVQLTDHVVYSLLKPSDVDNWIRSLTETEPNQNDND